MRVLRTGFDLLRKTFAEWNEDNVPRLAAGLAYYIAFALAPLLVITIAVVGFVLQEQFVREEVLGLVTNTVGTQASELVAELIDGLRQPSSGILSTVLGLGALCFGAINAFDQLKSALNIVWDVPDDKIESGIRGMVKSKVLSFGMVLMIGFLLLVSLVLSTFLSAFDGYIANLFPSADVVLRVVNMTLSLGIIIVLFALIYRFLPAIRLQWRDVWIGAVFTAILFTIGKYALSLYLGSTGTASAYGAAGSFVLILLWIYYSAQIVLFGAEFTQVYARQYGSLRQDDNSTEQNKTEPRGQVKVAEAQTT
ncbi:MAG: YihY/virulence factor BrkB family protein [Anaerolineae bacterium]|nr:YihY/virulence factor BrkB family protein [Anaerolineae bacterium]